MITMTLCTCSGGPPAASRIEVDQLYVLSRPEMGPVVADSQLALRMLVGPYYLFVSIPYEK
jgi:hypothetical protein